jgi:uncharacterized protein involved in outer membrane biogenesis
VSGLTRKLSIIALIVVALYALAGFIILPWWLERAIPDRLEQHMGWQATIDNVRVNPFAMSLEASALAADDSDGEAVLAFDRLYVNIGVLQLVTGIVALDNLELDEPFARLDLREDYSINFARDWQLNNPPSEEQAEKEPEPSDPVKLLLSRVRVAGGNILFRDYSQSEPEEFDISPLDLSLNDLSTWPREDSESSYYLLAAIGGQSIEWEGDLSLAPLYSTGYLRIADVRHTTLSHFLKPYLPYDLKDGTLTVSTRYSLSSGEQFSLSTSEGELEISDAALTMTADSEAELLRVGRISIPGIGFSLIDRELSVGTVALDKMVLGLERDEEGLLNLLGPFAGDAQEAEEDASGTASDDSPFYWSLAGLELTNGQVNWLDNQPETAVDFSLEQLNLSVGQLSDKLSDPVNYEAGLALASGGRVSLRGQTTLQPFTLEAGLSVADLNLTQLDPYVREVANLSLRDGLLSLDGNLDLDNQQSPLTGTFSGTGQIASLDARMADSGSPLVAWKNLRLEPVEYNLAPARLEIGTLTLSEPNVNVVRQQGGLHNLALVLPDSGQEPAAKDPSPGGEESERPAFIFRIGQIMLEGGEVSYADRTLEPVFATRIDRLNGSVTGLSNVAPQQGKVSMQGRIGDVASVKFDGSLGTLGAEDVSNLLLKVDGLSLPALSPYLGRYLGYGISNGRLNLDMNYEITGSRIDASNRIVLDRMELGDSVLSEQAVNAPVKLGLALLRDGRGVIDINLPIQGDLGDPQFRIAPVVMGTFVNLVARAATSPFSMLGSLAEMTGLTGEELGYVSFEPGKVAMASGSQKKLEALSQALVKRPSLLLKLRGAVSPDADGDILRRQMLAEELGISELPSAADRIARLESRYQGAGIEQPLAAYRQQVVNEESSADETSLDDAVWETALVSRLLPQVDLPAGALEDLARARGVQLRGALKEDFDVPDDQLFLLEPLQEANQDDRGAVKVSFELEAR